MTAPTSLTVGPITVTDIVRFAGAGGDFNPLHHDEPFARAQGFPGLIAMGQMQAGMLTRLLTDCFPLAEIRGYRVRFVAPVRVGDTLTLAIDQDETDQSTGTHHLLLSATRDDEVVVIRGEADIGPPE
jgi:3-hydroxybutyryl-CoA dehydratase